MTGRSFVAACVQLNSGNILDESIAPTLELVHQAADRGAHYVQTPEMTSIVEKSRSALMPQLHAEHEDPALQALRDTAAERGIWMHVGSLALLVAPETVVNRAFLIAPDGGIAARYDKIHMYDVDLPGGESYRESHVYRPGEKAIYADLPWGRLGITICYDIRFPHLYRGLAKEGAEVLSAPAAFTRQTGEAHWHVLQRARAIENGCFVISAAQAGTHEDGRETFGHSMIVDPWGKVLAEASEPKPGVILAEIDLAETDVVRGRVPSLKNERAFEIGPADERSKPQRVAS